MADILIGKWNDGIMGIGIEQCHEILIWNVMMENERYLNGVCNYRIMGNGM